MLPVLIGRLDLVFIALPRFTKIEGQLEVHLDCWLYFLKHTEKLDTMPTVFQDKIIERDFTIAELHALSEEDRQRYQDELKHYRDAFNMLRTARRKDIEKGIKQALNRLIL